MIALCWECSGILNWVGKVTRFRWRCLPGSLTRRESSRPRALATGERRRPQSEEKYTHLNTPTLLIESLQLKNKVAIVTGGSRGIGRAAVRCFASLGANVVVNYVSDE